ncbi:hypothetical protein Mal15_57760 [Stieleria maiorica]|uniref:Uncharacterized protein n=1 Tax=Stieleria maiorica TaxID=2795974 RepID=A0A5B9MRP0_9BACT|nr:hypothetical protein [Stieleria maiorica]QEG01698.1 hypothetical protein Mal15_57760 [Stieleria maiorica]
MAMRAESMPEPESPVASAAAVAAENAGARLDSSTRPFEFRSANPAWPLVGADDGCQLSVRIRALPQHADRDLVLSYELIRVDDGVMVGREQTDLRLDASGDSTAIAIAASSPRIAGVYEIRCRLSEKTDRIWSRLTGSENELASVQTPWMVFQDLGEPTESAAQSGPAIAPLQWRQRGPIRPLDPSDWQPLGWMPNGATQLVPKVKRVSESLPFTPRRAASGNEPHTIGPGESWIGLLSDLNVHQPYQLSLTLTEPKAPSPPKTVRIEFANRPDFDPVTDSLSVQLGRPMDVSSEDDAAVITQQILHYAHRDNEFVRITNDSSDHPLSVESLVLAEQDVDRSAPQTAPPTRQVAFWVESTGWLSHLTSDHADQLSQGGYAQSTVLMFSLWKATSRLATHAAWCGYDNVSVPIDLHQWDFIAGGQPADASAPAKPTWIVKTITTAIESWTAPGGLRVQPRLTHGHRSVSMENVDRQSRPHLLIGGQSSLTSPARFLESCVHEGSRVLSIRTVELPFALNRSFRQTMNHCRAIAADARPVRSASNSESDYVHVLVSEASHNRSPDQASSIDLTVINTAPWTSQVKLRFSNERIADCSLLCADDPNAILRPTGASDSRLLTLAPTSIVRLQVRGESEPVSLAGWYGSMVGGDQTLQRLKGHVSAVVGKIGTLASPEDYNELTNGGFEIQGQVGIVGWMHTQFPSDAVTLDSTESIEGSHSIRMTSDTASAGRIWLVSEPIPVPASGRMAVSLSVRAGKRTADANPAATNVLKSTATEPPPNEPPRHRVRVSLEGNRLRKPVRFSTEFDVPCDGHWQPRHLVLEADQIHRDQMESVRLTIDSLSPGKLWIDDIHLHDHFPTEAERTALQENAFLAIQGLQRGNLKPAAGLLNNDWSRDLMARSAMRPTPSPRSTDRNPPPVAGVVKQTGAVPADEASNSRITSPPPQKRESVADRLRDWLPKPIRF